MAPPAPAWIVLFPSRAAQPAPPRWWQRALAPGWRHCLALVQASIDSTLVVEHVGTHLRVATLPQPIGVTVAEMQDSLVAMVLLVPPIARSPAAELRGPMTCVEAVKAALGLRAPAVITPRALFRHLRRHHGARVVLPATS